MSKEIRIDKNEIDTGLAEGTVALSAKDEAVDQPSIIETDSFWVMIAFIATMAFLWHKGAFRAIGGALDKRSDQIRKELEEAQALKEEAQALLASYQRRQRKVVEDAESILSNATAEANRIIARAEGRIEEEVKKRTELAEQKIAQAQAAAIRDVSARAVDITISASEALLTSELSGKASTSLLDDAVSDVGSRFN